MGSKGDSCENNFLLLLFNNTTWANIGDATGLEGSGTAGSFYVSLHTADVTDSGNQSSSECTYGSYARQPVARSSAGWTVSTNTVTNFAQIDFPEASSGSETATHFAVGRDSSGTGEVLYHGTLSPSVAISTGVQPYIAAGDLDITED